MIEPRQPGKFPLVFVHGFFSSPDVWAEAANEILADPHLRDRYQLMAYSYPTGRPFVESAAILRRELTAFTETYNADGQDSSMSNMVIIGHSMGGLVAKLTVTHSDDRLWYSIANRPLSDINVSDEGRQRLANLFYFEPLPFVRRVVFVGTPHDGAALASQSIGRLMSRCVEHPADQMIEHNLLIQANPDVFSPEVAQRIPTSIDMLDPHSCLLQAVQGLCAGQGVQFHNIVGAAFLSPLNGCGDGVVAVRSAQHPCVSTEKRIHANHTRLHQDLESIREMRCILRRHLLEADDQPLGDPCEDVTPDGGESDFSEPCPPEAWIEECADVLELEAPTETTVRLSPGVDWREWGAVDVLGAAQAVQDPETSPPDAVPELFGPELVIPAVP
jgi:pimeloyl-ACP methyl ester carboxylesterase